MMRDYDEFRRELKAEHDDWMERRGRVEKGWMTMVRPVLEKGPAPTSALAAVVGVRSRGAAGVAAGREYSRFVAFLKKTMRCIGVVTGSSKHPNRMWALK